MKLFSLSCFTLLALLCGCRSAGTFKPQWLSDPSQVVYSSEYEGNVRVKLKAKVTESEFVAAIERLKLIPHTEDSEYPENIEALRWKRGPDKRWDHFPSLAAHAFLITLIGGRQRNMRTAFYIINCLISKNEWRTSQMQEPGDDASVACFTSVVPGR